MRKQNGKPYHILIAGGDSWFSQGDNAILAGTLQILSGEMPGSEIAVLTDRPDITRRFHPGVHATYRRDLAAVWKAMGKSDLVLWGGGQLIQNISSQAFILFQLTLLNFAYAQRIPVMGFALGAAELRGRLWRTLTRRAIDRLAAITVRDKGTQQALMDLGVRKSIEVTADPALVLEPEDGEQVLMNEAIPSRFAIIAPRRWFHYRHTLLPIASGPASDEPQSGKFEAVLEGLAQTADWLIESRGLGVLFVPMYPGATQRDEFVCQEIRRRMHHSSHSLVLQGSYNPQVLLGLFGMARVVVGLRLHSAILSTCGAVPSMIVYNQLKGLSFFEQIDMRKFAFPIDNIDWPELRSSLARLLEDRPLYVEKLRDRRDSLAAAARLSGRIAHDILLEN